jgi:integration host factor subunit beta
MNKPELIERLARELAHLSEEDVALAVRAILECMSRQLAAGERIEIRGFGSFDLQFRAPRLGRNPKTGASVGVPAKYVAHFKPGKALRMRVNAVNAASC